MAYIYSTSPQTTSAYGNTKLRINIYRGDCTRTATSVSFEFGVSFTRPSDANTGTVNSVAAWYNGEQRFAKICHGSNNYMPRSIAHHAYWKTKSSSDDKYNTTETLVYTYTNNDISAGTNSVDVTVGVGWADWAGSKQGEITFPLSIPEFYGGLVDNDKIVITDNFNNTFTIEATKADAGVNNTSNGPSNLKWGYTSDRDNSYENDSAIALNISGSSAYRTVYAEATTTAGTTPTSGSSSLTAYAEANIRQYVGPNAPTGLRLTFTKSRLTFRENWTLSWVAPSINNECPIKGYRIRIYRKRGEDITKLPIYNSSGKILSTKNEKGDIYYDRDTAAVLLPGVSKSTITIYPNYYLNSGELKVGDLVSFAITAYTKYGENYDGDRKFKTSESYYFSDTSAGGDTDSSRRKWVEIRNAGIVNVKTKDGWAEGLVYVKTKDGWQEAETVNIKTSAGWQESQ
jgi:hypothetical protein